jgi:Ser/Thr protein kinase RdoA (MazF antagonist)
MYSAPINLTRPQTLPLQEPVANAPGAIAADALKANGSSADRPRVDQSSLGLLQPLPERPSEPLFPVSYSSLSQQALIDRVLSQYPIGPVTQCNFWNRGLSDVYWVGTADRAYILRVSHAHWRTQEEVQFELELLDFLQQQQFPAAYPLRTEQGQLAVTIPAAEGCRYASLFTYAIGEVPLGDLNPSQGQILGRTVAQLHQITQPFTSPVARPDLSLDYLLDPALKTIAPFLQHKPDGLDYLVGTIAELKAKLQDFPQAAPLWGICWGDAHSGNAHFTERNEITLFDFDQCGYGWRIFEIAKFFQVALSTGLSRTIRDAFLAGYEAAAPLTPLERELLQTFTQVAHVWSWGISLTHAMVYQYSKLDDYYFHSRLEVLKRLKSPDWQ